MPEKPSRAADYNNVQIQLVKETCLYIATVLEDYMEQVVIVGGLVPSILKEGGSITPACHAVVLTKAEAYSEGGSIATKLIAKADELLLHLHFRIGKKSKAILYRFYRKP